MTREESKELLPTIHAFADGKRTIQDWIKDTWKDKKYTPFGELSQSPIKPQPKYRPFKTQEECWEEMQKHHPFGSLKSKDNEYFCIIGSVNKDNTITLAIEPNTDYSCTYIFEHYIFSDGTPFGIKEE